LHCTDLFINELLFSIVFNTRYKDYTTTTVLVFEYTVCFTIGQCHQYSTSNSDLITDSDLINSEFKKRTSG